MSWREKLGLPETGDRSDKSTPSVTSVTGFPYEPTVDSADEPFESRPPEVAREPERGVSWAEWKAAALNQLFREQGVTGQPGHITAATVRHGETGRRRLDSVTTNEQPMSRAEATE